MKGKGNHRLYGYGYTHMWRKEAQYVQTDECLRNKERENGNEEKRERASLGPHQSVSDTCPARVSLAPTQQPFSPSEIRQMDPQKKIQKKPTEDHFSLTSGFLAGRRKEHLGAGAQPRLAPSLEELPPATAPNPICATGTIGLEQPWGFPLQTQTH